MDVRFADLDGYCERQVWGHEDQFPPPGLSDRCWLCEATFAGTDVNGREAPIPAVRGLEIERQNSGR